MNTLGSLNCELQRVTWQSLCSVYVTNIKPIKPKFATLTVATAQRTLCSSCACAKVTTIIESGKVEKEMLTRGTGSVYYGEAVVEQHESPC